MNSVKNPVFSLDDWSENDLANLRDSSDFASISPRKTQRRRGDHSTACKCPVPKFTRPEHFGQLPPILRKSYHRLLKRKFSRNPYFVQMQHVAGRQRGFRETRQRLLDALAVLLVSGCDIATFNVTLNSSQMRKALSNKDNGGNIIESEAVTDSRICRLLDELVRFGLIEPYLKKLDPYTKSYLPRHVTLTEQFFKLAKTDLDLLYKEQDKRLKALSEGILSPGETMSVRAARQRFHEQKVIDALKVRRARAAEQKRLSTLGSVEDLDERQYQIAAWLIKTRPEVAFMTPDDFEVLVFHYLRQIHLEFDGEPPN